MLFLHADKPHVQSVRLERQPPVIDAQTVQDGRVHGVDMQRVLDDGVAEIVCLSIRDAALDTAAASSPGSAAGGADALFLPRGRSSGVSWMRTSRGAER